MNILSAGLFPMLLAASLPVRALPDRDNVSGFGARLVIAENPREYIEAWCEPNIPRIHSATEVRRDVPVGAFVVTMGCKPDVGGSCNAEVDYTIYRPDGAVFAVRRAEALWRGEASPNLRLAQGFLDFRIGKDDPAGEYKVRAKVSDLNARLSFELETKVRVP